MRKLLTLFLVLIGTLSFAQPVVDRMIITNFMSTSDMIWNARTSNFDFIDNNDREIWKTSWEITLFDNGTGRIQSGDITYTVKEWVFDTSNENPMIRTTTYNHKLSRDVVVIIHKDKKTEEFMLSVYDKDARISYYFWQ
jgi:hypothetical protein